MRKPHTWTDVHEPARLNEEADEQADVFRIVSDREEKLIETYHINFAGQTMNTQTNDQFATKLDDQIVKTKNQYADPMDIISKHLPDASRDYFARVTNSLHWYMQMSVIGSARVSMINLYKVEDRPGDVAPDEFFKNFCLGLHDTLKQDSIWQDNDELKSVAEKYKLMMEWEEHAISAANANDRDYAPKALLDLMLAEKPAAVNVSTRANYKAHAEYEARHLKDKPVIFAAEVEKNLQILLGRAEDMARMRTENNRGLIGYVEVMIEGIAQHQPAYVIFASMDKRFQRSAIDFTINTMNRIVVQDIATSSKVMPATYLAILKARDAAIEELESFRKQYADESEDLEAKAAARLSAKEEAHQRAQKEFASSEKGAAAIDAGAKGQDPVQAAAAVQNVPTTKQTTADIPTTAPATPVIESTKPANKPVKVGDKVKA